MLLWAQQYYCLFHISKNYFMANELQDGSEVVDFQKGSSTKDGLFNKRSTEWHVNLEIFCVSA